MNIKTLFSIQIVIVCAALLSSGCSSKNMKEDDRCAQGTTKVDGVCVSQKIADYVSCVRAQGTHLSTDKNNTLSADVGYFAINASVASDVSEKLEKKYSVSDEAMINIIEQCNRLSGISSKTKLSENLNSGNTLSVDNDVIDTIYVSSRSSTKVFSSISLEDNVKYRLEVKGTYDAGDTIIADADYSLTNKITNDAWSDSVTNYERYGERLLNLLVYGHGDRDSINWGQYRDDHLYTAIVTGRGVPLGFVIYDLGGGSNNSGGLTVNIYSTN